MSASCQFTKDNDSTNLHQEEKSLIDGRYRTLVLSAGIASTATATILIALKFGVWLYSGSSSILASLTDSVLDLGASLVNLLALRYALTPPDKDHRFGHFKAEALASLTQAAFIGGSAFLLIFHGLAKFKDPEPLEIVNIAIAVSIASMVLTIALVCYQAFVCKLTKSEAVGADRYHYLSDIILNLGVIAALVLSNLGYLWADGLFAALLGVYILKGSIHIGLTAIETLLDRSFSASEHETIIRRLMEIPGIKSLHDLRTRRAGPQCFIQCHIVIDGHVTLKAAHDIASASERALEKLYPDTDIMIHMEPDEDATYQDIRFYGKADLHGAEEPSLKENCPLQESGWQRDNKLKQQALKLEQEAKVKAQDKSLSFEEQWAVEEEEEISSKNLKEKLESLKHESGGKREKW